MTLIIEQGTEKGKIQLEAIKWAEEQFNQVLGKVFTQYRLLRGLTIQLIIPDGTTKTQMEVNVSQIAPKTKIEFLQAAKQAEKSLGFDEPPIVGEIVEEHGTNKS